MLFYLELSSRDLSEWQSREKGTKALQYVSHARKLEGNVWEYPPCFAGVCPTFYREKVYFCPEQRAILLARMLKIEVS